MLRVEKLSKSYNKELFSEISFTLGNNEKVGLVGLNGCGKSTLFRLISGVEEPDKGLIGIPEEGVGYLPQELKFPNGIFVGEFLESLVEDISAERYKIEKILGELKMNDLDDYQYVEELSDGQRMKLYLTKLLMDAEVNNYTNKKPILLLDEPTNHLDIDGIIWFEQFISRYKGVAMIVSHDRNFLNNTVTKVFEIDEESLNIFEGNYDNYLEQKEKWIYLRRKQFVHQEKQRKKLEKLLENSRKLADGKRRGKAIRAAKKRMEREVTKNEVDQYEEKKIQGMEISGSIHKKKRMLKIEDLIFSYDGENNVIDGLELDIWGKEKIWLYGSNGSGKTTLVKLILDLLQPVEGHIQWGENIKFAYFSQDQSHLDMDNTVAEYFIESAGVTYQRSFSALEKFLFDKSYRDMPIRDLSPGQRARLSFAVFAQGDYDFLILDEPTNHLDIQTKELIERALQDFEGNILLISHDRYFVEQIDPDRAIRISDGELTELEL